MRNCLKWMMVALGRLCLFVTTFFFSFSLGLGTTYPSTFWILPLSSSILFSMIFVISAIYKRCASNQKNEETRTPIDERTRLNDDDDENENERTNENRSKRTQVMKEEDPPILHACQPCLALLCISLVFTGDLIYLRCFCSLLLASLPCNVDTLLAWEEKGTPRTFFFNNAKWKS